MKQKVLLLILFYCLNATSNYAQQVVPITQFGNNGTFWKSAAEVTVIQNMLVQPDGKLLFSVFYATETGYSSNEYLYRLTPSGKLDKGFGNGGFIQMGLSGNFADLKRSACFDIQPDGKIISATVAANSNAVTSDALIVERWLPDGRLDSTFGNNGYFTKNGYFAGAIAVGDVKIKTDGKILIGGKMFFSSDYKNLGSIQLNSNGQADNNFVSYEIGFNSTINNILLLPDNKFIATVNFRRQEDLTYSTNLIAFNANGTVDSLKPNKGIFFNNNVIYNNSKTGLALQPNGKILEYINDGTSAVLVRFASNGFDKSFGENGKVEVVTSNLPDVHIIGLEYNNKIIVNASPLQLKRYFSNGTLDVSFGENGVFTVNDFDIGQTNFSLFKKRLYTGGVKYVAGGYPERFGVKAYQLCDTCTSTTTAGVVEDATVSRLTNIKLFPNPVKDQLQISGLNCSSCRLQLTDASGQILKTVTTQNATYQWNVQDLPAGVYFVKIDDAGKPSYSFSILKQ